MSSKTAIRRMLGYDLPVVDSTDCVPIYIAGFSGLSTDLATLQFTYEPTKALTFSDDATANLFKRLWRLPSSIYVAQRRCTE